MSKPERIDAVLVTRIDDMPEPAMPSEARICRLCGYAVWLSRDLVEVVGHGLPLWCLQCATERVKATVN